MSILQDSSHRWGFEAVLTCVREQMVAHVSELSRQVHTDLFPQLWRRLGAKIQGWGCFYPPLLFSVYSSLGMRHAAEIPRASPKTVCV